MSQRMRTSMLPSRKSIQTFSNHHRQNKTFFDKVSEMGNRLKGKKGKTFKHEINNIMSENNINKSDENELRHMGSELEDLLNNTYEWEKVNNAIQNKKYKQYFLSMVNNGASSAVSIATTPFRYMARGAAGLVLLAVTDRATNMTVEQINESTLETIEDIKNHTLAQQKSSVKPETYKEILKEEVNNKVDKLQVNKITKQKIIREVPSILLFLLLSFFVYYIEKASNRMGGGIKKRKKQTRKSKRKGRRRKRTRKY